MAWTIQISALDKIKGATNRRTLASTYVICLTHVRFRPKLTHRCRRLARHLPRRMGGASFQRDCARTMAHRSGPRSNGNRSAALREIRKRLLQRGMRRRYGCAGRFLGTRLPGACMAARPRAALCMGWAAYADICPGTCSADDERTPACRARQPTTHNKNAKEAWRSPTVGFSRPAPSPVRASAAPQPRSRSSPALNL